MLSLLVTLIAGSADAAPTPRPKVFELGRGQTWSWTLPVSAGQRYIVTADVLGGVGVRIDGNTAELTTGADASITWTVADGSDGAWFIAPSDGQVTVSVTGETGYARGVVSIEPR